MTITDNGVAGMDAETSFDSSAIAGLLPDYAVRPGLAMTEGMEVPIITISTADGEVLTITPTRDEAQIFSVIVRSGEWEGPPDRRIGGSYESVYDNQPAPNCLPGIEELSGAVFCLAPSATRVWYVFHGLWSGPDGTVPPTNALAPWTVGEIVWTRSDLRYGCWWVDCGM